MDFLTLKQNRQIEEYAISQGLNLIENASDEICEKIKNSSISIISLSIDSTTAATHFEAIVNAALFLKKMVLPFFLNSSFTKRNHHEIKDVYKLAKSLEATAWYLFMIVCLQGMVKS